METKQSIDEPKCLIKPESKWYRPGQGFTCRQIMLPLMSIALMLLVLTVVQGYRVLESSSPDALGIVLLGLHLVMLGLIIRAIFFVRRSLLNPLTQVRLWVSKVWGGDFSARMPTLSNGEFNDLANDINSLASVLQNLNEDLESEVNAKTEKLAQKTQALELLYEVVTSVNDSNDVSELLNQFLHRLGEVFQSSAGVVRELRESQLHLLDSYGLDTNSPYTEPRVPIRFVIRNSLFGKGTPEVRIDSLETALRTSEGDVETAVDRVISVPLFHRDSILGSYQFFVSSGQKLPEDTRELLANVGQHLGVAIEQSRLDNDAARLLMVEERTKLANELHDSLAQTLASLRFQVRVLDETLHQGEEQLVWQELEQLEGRVEEANSEVRSMIGQFRAPLQEREVVVSVQNLIRKFRQDTGISVFFQNEWSDDQLTHEMRTHVVRIVQESLTNIKKHARANTVRVVLRNHRGHYRIMVEDDGVGFNEELVDAGDAGTHVGQQIMAERAEALGGELRVESEVEEGTSITVEFEYHPSGRTGATAVNE